MELVPIKVKILLGPGGKHEYPAFDQIPPPVRDNLDWSTFVDKKGTGWHYDKLSGHGEVDQGDANGPHINNDTSCWYGAMCVPAAFADHAVSRFPTLVEIISEEAWGQFYDVRSHCQEETEILDLPDLQKLQARVALEADTNVTTVEPSPEILRLRAEMLDPNHLRRGIRKNPKKTWTGYKALRGIEIRAAERKPE